MSKRSIVGWMVAVFAVLAAVPLYAQGETGSAPAAVSVIVASIISAGFGLGIAAGLGAIGQGRAIGSTAEAIARNPSTAGELRGLLILGLVFIESLVIYVLFIAITLVFIRPWG